MSLTPTLRSQREENLYEFKTSLFYTASFNPAKAAQWDSLSKRTKTIKEKEKKITEANVSTRLKDLNIQFKKLKCSISIAFHDIAKPRNHSK